jgi:hypothetical protein
MVLNLVDEQIVDMTSPCTQAIWPDVDSQKILRETSKHATGACCLWVKIANGYKEKFSYGDRGLKPTN